VPTLSALTRARRQWKPIPRTNVTGLLVCESSTGHSRLHNAVDEVYIVKGCFEAVSAQVLNIPSAHTSLDQVKSHLGAKPAHIVHMACHGIQAKNPLTSSFLMQDGRLSIEHIMKLNLPQAVLAYLSACQTAKGTRVQPDQAIHLAASMLFCGFKSVIGTMWCVFSLTAKLLGSPSLVSRLMHDEDGPQVARRVYESLFRSDFLDLDDIPYALDDAVCILRSSGVAPSRWALFVHMGG
jgi:CHAT domain-containing protein